MADKKVKYSKSKEAGKNLRKNLFKKKKKAFQDIIIADASAFGGPETRLKEDLYMQDRSPENFPGFDQAKRIRGGLKGGGISQRGLGRAFKKGGKV